MVIFQFLELPFPHFFPFHSIIYFWIINFSDWGVWKVTLCLMQWVYLLQMEFQHLEVVPSLRLGRVWLILVSRMPSYPKPWFTTCLISSTLGKLSSLDFFLWARQAEVDEGWWKSWEKKSVLTTTSLGKGVEVKSKLESVPSLGRLGRDDEGESGESSSKDNLLSFSISLMEVGFIKNGREGRCLFSFYLLWFSA